MPLLPVDVPTEPIEISPVIEPVDEPAETENLQSGELLVQNNTAPFVLDIITFVEVSANTTTEISLGAITDEEDDQVSVTNV